MPQPYSHGQLGITSARRPDLKQPGHPRCQTAYRRICGVCAAFDGSDMRTRGTCKKLGFDVRGTEPATTCQYWSRKMADAVPKRETGAAQTSSGAV